MKAIHFFFIGIISIVFLGCENSKMANKLPILGSIEGTNYAFLSQDSAVITPANFEDKIYVTDFFFTTCPTICPTMKAQMLRVYEAFENNDNVMLLSHTIDPQHDTVSVLKNYADGLGISSNTWLMVTGKKKEIFGVAEKYMVSALEDESQPGGLVHSGAFELIDKNKKIRGYYDGTKEMDTNELIADMKILLDE